MTSRDNRPLFVGDRLFDKGVLSWALKDHVDGALQEVVYLRNRNAPRMAVAKVRRWAVSAASLTPLTLDPGRPRVAVFSDLDSLRPGAGGPRTMVAMYVGWRGSGELWQWAPDDVKSHDFRGDVRPFGEEGELTISATVAIGHEAGVRAALEDCRKRLERLLHFQKQQLERFNKGVPALVEAAFPTLAARKKVLDELKSLGMPAERTTD